MNQKLVNFRGNSEGIIISVKKGEIDDIISEIEQKIDESRDFFKGAKVRSISGESLGRGDQSKIEAVLKEKYNMIIELTDLEAEERKRESRRRAKKLEALEMARTQLGKDREGKTKFVESTVRSGQLIEYDGNIVVIGDVNPGGVISAGGNIVVLGALKGIARAGTSGDSESMVAAFSLEPTQLKIADVMSRKPDEDVEKPEWPEIAKIQDGMIVIESYLKRSSRR